MQIDEEKVQTVTDFLFFGSKITVDSDCRHEIKMIAKPRQHIEKQNVTLPSMVHIVKAMAFPVFIQM